MGRDRVANYIQGTACRHDRHLQLSLGSYSRADDASARPGARGDVAVLSDAVHGKPQREVALAMNRMITGDCRKLVWERLFWSIRDVVDEAVSAKVMDVVWLNTRWN